MDNENQASSQQVVQEGSSVDVSGDIFHDMENHGRREILSLLLSVTALNGQALGTDSYNDRTISAMIQRKYQIRPLTIEVVNRYDAIVELEHEVQVSTLAQLLHGRTEFNGQLVEITCLMAGRAHLERIADEREEGRRRMYEMERERRRHQQANEEREQRLENLLKRFGQEVERVEQIKQEISPRGKVESPVVEKKLTRPPHLPYFSGAEPVPKDEGSYTQWIFQVKEAIELHTEAAVRSGIVSSVRGRAREVLEMVGLSANIQEILDYLEKRLGHVPTTDRLQKEWYEVRQDKGESVTDFAGRLEDIYKKLEKQMPSKYDKEELRKRFFFGMTQNLRDSMRYLYETSDIGYEEFLIRTKKIEDEFHQNRTGARMKSTVVEESGGEIAHLKKEIEELTAVMKSANLQGVKPKKESPRKENGQPTQSRSPRGKGPQTSSAGPFRPGQRVLQCYNCGGWGHTWKECASPENMDWRALARAGANPPIKPKDGSPNQTRK